MKQLQNRLIYDIIFVKKQKIGERGIYGLYGLNELGIRAKAWHCIRVCNGILPGISKKGCNTKTS